MTSQVWPWRRRYSRMATRFVCTPPCGGGYGPSCTTLIGLTAFLYSKPVILDAIAMLHKLWGRMVSCAPRGNRRLLACLQGVPAGYQPAAGCQPAPQLLLNSRSHLSPELVNRHVGEWARRGDVLEAAAQRVVVPHRRPVDAERRVDGGLNILGVHVEVLRPAVIDGVAPLRVGLAHRIGRAHV